MRVITVSVDERQKRASSWPPLQYQLGKPNYVNLESRLIRGNHRAVGAPWRGGTGSLTTSLFVKMVRAAGRRCKQKSRK
jgi:hypothetical protein